MIALIKTANKPISRLHNVNYQMIQYPYDQCTGWSLKIRKIFRVL